MRLIVHLEVKTREHLRESARNRQKNGSVILSAAKNLGWGVAKPSTSSRPSITHRAREQIAFSLDGRRLDEGECRPSSTASYMSRIHSTTDILVCAFERRNPEIQAQKRGGSCAAPLALCCMYLPSDPGTSQPSSFQRTSRPSDSRSLSLGRPA